MPRILQHLQAHIQLAAEGMRILQARGGERGGDKEEGLAAVEGGDSQQEIYDLCEELRMSVVLKFTHQVPVLVAHPPPLYKG